MPSPKQGASSRIRLFTPVDVAMGTAFGSLIAGIGMVWWNYRVLGYHALAGRIAAAGIVLYLMVIVAGAMAPQTIVVGIALMIAQCLFAAWCTSSLQGKAISYYVQRGGSTYGSAFAAVVGLAIGIGAAMILLLFGRATGLPIGIG